VKIANTMDELLAAATMGVLPSADDIAAVEVPPGKGAKAFAAEVEQVASEIVGLRKSGEMGKARRMAAEAATAYLDAFDKQAKPKKSGALKVGLDEEATADEIAARPPHKRSQPLATPSELAGRVRNPNTRH
jgi:hypothetical protein